MAERARPTFDTQAVAKALGTQAQAVTDPAYGEGQHFQVRSNGSFLSLDTFPERGVSRITTKGARIELFGDMLPRVEDEGIVFLRKDSDHEHASMALHPDARIRHQSTTGTFVVPTKVTVDELLDLWLKSAIRGVEEATASNYDNAIRPSRLFLGDKRLQLLTEEDVEVFVDWMLTRGRQRGGKPGTGLGGPCSPPWVGGA
ncbi:hypothetical protein [Streptomyces canus]|uniref:hypothetical protein n=1 Tax=Streptomyces canus TaxID=58343 RepID=UPI002DD9613C|nr:hypothetical protein [Streptomyces canus]WSD84499.1 hypothetical protein OG925_09405 [Streptomyces canus]